MILYILRRDLLFQEATTYHQLRLVKITRDEFWKSSFDPVDEVHELSLVSEICISLHGFYVTHS